MSVVSTTQSEEDLVGIKLKQPIPFALNATAMLWSLGVGGEDEIASNQEDQSEYLEAKTVNYDD